MLSSESLPSQVRSLPPVLRRFTIATMLLSLLCVAVEFVCRHLGRYGLNQLPYSSPTLVPKDAYADAWLFNKRFYHFHSSSFFAPQYGSAYMYPAPLGFFYRLFRFFPHTTPAVLGFLLLIYLGLGIWLRYVLIERGLSNRAASLFSVVSVVFSYPLYFEFDRANMEIFVWGFAALGVLCFFRNRPWLAATLIGCAAACKGYPFIFLGLLFARKQYAQVAYSIALAVGINYFSLWALAGSISVGKIGVAAGIAQFRDSYILVRDSLSIGLDHSLFGFFKRFWPNLPAPPELGHLLTIYIAVAGLTACVLYLFFVMRLPAINQLIFLTTACLLLPPTSFDYTLLHLYTPWVVLVTTAVDCQNRGVAVPRGVWPAMFCFIILLSPQNELIVHGVRVAAQVKCLALLALTYVALRLPLQRRTDLPESVVIA